MGHEISKGSVVTGRKALAKDLELSETQIRTALKKLETTQEITIKTTNKFSIVSICKYKEYQSEEGRKQPKEQPTDNQQATNKQPTSNHIK